MKKEKGIGSFALLLGLTPTIFTASYNGVSLMKLAMDTFQFTYSPYMSAAGLLLSVPGLFLGLSHRDDWGAKLGSLLCGLNVINVFVQFGMAYLPL